MQRQKPQSTQSPNSPNKRIHVSDSRLTQCFSDAEPPSVWGRRVEVLARARLEAAGYQFLCQNFFCRGGEIDLIFADRLELVFVEVRARKAGLALALESVNGPKRRRLVRAMEVYLQQYSGPAQSMRLDILAFDGEDWAHAKAVL